MIVESPLFAKPQGILQLLITENAPRSGRSTDCYVRPLPPRPPYSREGLEGVSLGGRGLRQNTPQGGQGWGAGLVARGPAGGATCDSHQEEEVAPLPAPLPPTAARGSSARAGISFDGVVEATQLSCYDPSSTVGHGDELTKLGSDQRTQSERQQTRINNNNDNDGLVCTGSVRSDDRPDCIRRRDRLHVCGDAITNGHNSGDRTFPPHKTGVQHGGGNPVQEDMSGAEKVYLWWPVTSYSDFVDPKQFQLIAIVSSAGAHGASYWSTIEDGDRLKSVRIDELEQETTDDGKYTLYYNDICRLTDPKTAKWHILNSVSFCSVFFPNMFQHLEADAFARLCISRVVARTMEREEGIEDHLCERIRNGIEHLHISVFSRVCTEDYQYTGLSYPGELCCHGGKGVDCSTIRRPEATVPPS
ncbi:hypothetical protein AAG570_004889 [Ranatra chinensis]|uniref:Uncharacterized protein n=1 Tax=Ranatra chinensis TaxID=642074 RepID=A0ABD0Y0H0_9HEMI